MFDDFADWLKNSKKFVLAIISYMLYCLSCTMKSTKISIHSVCLKLKSYLQIITVKSPKKTDTLGAGFLSFVERLSLCRRY